MDQEKTPLTEETDEFTLSSEPVLRKLPKAANKRTVLVCLLAILLVLGGVITALVLTREPAPPEEEIQYILNTEEIPSRVQVSSFTDGVYQEKESYTLVKKDGAWVVEGQDFSVNQSVAGEVVYTTIQSSRVILENAAPELLAQYQLDKPVRTVTFTFADSTVTIRIGKRYSETGGFYAALSNSSTVHLITDLAGEALMTSFSQLREMPELIPSVYHDGIDRIALDGKSSFLLTKSDTVLPDTMHWQIAKPYTLSASDEQVTAFIENLADLTPDEYVGKAEDLSAYGLDQPALTLTLDSYSDTRFTLEVGGMAENSTNRYCRFNGGDILLMDSSKLGFLENFSVYQYVHRYLTYYNLKNVSDIKIYKGGALHAEFTFNGEEDTAKQVFTANGEVCDGDQFKTMYQTLLKLSYEGQLPADYTPQGEEIYAYEMTVNGVKERVAFLPYNQYSYAVKRNGNTVFYLSVSEAERFIETVDLLLEGNLQK